MNIAEKFRAVESASHKSYHGQRIFAELLYLNNVSKIEGDRFIDRFNDGVSALYDSIEKDGVITATASKAVEESLSDLSPEMKKYKVICTSHAHIDMNWMWGYQETVSVTVDTFRTVLNLMKEYPDFTYSQSQASTYKMIELHAPEMIEEIKQRVHEGRWELAASTWVETDKNMPNGESLSRHILYTKRYLSKLFDVSPDSLRLDFEPDTFGHNINVPEILQNGGVDYYYHCRGYEGENLYNWKSPSGKKILVYREYKWYNATVEYSTFSDLPLFCDRYKVDTGLNVYGVGDHGGGPTRRDVERIMDIASWPLSPSIRFGTYHEFFAEMEKFRNNFKTIDTELNFVFTGCYTSQSRIKMANRISEDRIYDSEMLSASASVLAGAEPKTELFGHAWENILFNHFHDILPGSGTIETREYALGRFQETLATVNTNANTAMRELADAIDTSSIPFDENNMTISEGGGVGFALSHDSGHFMPQTDRGRGKVRAVHLFNTTAYDRCEPVEVTLWDYPGDVHRLRICDSTGTEVPYEHLAVGQHYWGHVFTKLLIYAAVPAFGYSTYTVTERGLDSTARGFNVGGDRTDNNINDNNPVLENEHIRAEFNASTLELVSLIDKKSGEELVSRDRPSAQFRFIHENPRFGMTSWRVGPYMKVTNLNNAENVRLTEYRYEPLCKRLHYEIKFNSSTINVAILLYNNARYLDYDIKVDWHEIGSPSVGYIPQLNFFVPVAYHTGEYEYDVPFGLITRPALAHDVPGNSFMRVLNGDSKSVAIITDTKYGFRGCDDSGAVTLIRSSYDPDPYPELGRHHIRLAVAVACKCCIKKLAAQFTHPISFAAGTKHNGELPLDGTLFKVEGKVMASAVKNAEEGGVILRLAEYLGEDKEVTVTFARPVNYAALVDINENIIDDKSLNIEGNRVTFTVTANSISSLLLR